tara:strand:- start:3294 stop:3962 length:669 start_codon:yes stop_codon:yes gene_type:complete
LKLDRLLAKHQHMGRTRARESVMARRVKINDRVAKQHDEEIDRFAQVTLDDTIVQPTSRRLCLMLHKPIGVLSATNDNKHSTVIDLIDDPDKETLHLVGRLDINTSGLVLLTNDGRWSKTLMHPYKKVPKVYHVTTKEPIPPDAPTRFTAGFYFQTEDITTQPAGLEILTTTTARVTLHEGRYRQVRRMFHRVGCQVTALHRESIGDIQLPSDLVPGAWRSL